MLKLTPFSLILVKILARPLFNTTLLYIHGRIQYVRNIVGPYYNNSFYNICSDPILKHDISNC